MTAHRSNRIPSYGRALDGPLTVYDNRDIEADEERFAGVERDENSAPAYNQWTQVEQRVLHKAIAQVSVLHVPHGAPRYSIRVGTARVTESGQVILSNHISIYDAIDAATLLADLGDKYVDKRRTEKRPRRSEP